MAKKARSARGEVVDFDLIKIKQQMAAQPTSNDVRARQDFIERRLRRRQKKAVVKPSVKIKDVEVSATVASATPGGAPAEQKPKTTKQKAR